jgi:hypothetical protein
MKFSGREPAFEPRVEDEGKGLAFGKVQKRKRFAGAAGAIAPNKSNLAGFLLFAAVSSTRRRICLLFLLLLAAATGMVGTSLRRTAANSPIAGTLPGRGMSKALTAQNDGRERTDCDKKIYHRQKQGGAITRR